MDNRLLMMAAAAMLCACSGGDAEYDATGVFETTDVVVSAKGTGEIKSLIVEEGQTLKAGQEVGAVDVTQLRLRREQLSATRQATESRRLDAARQVSAVRQQIANQEREQERFRALLAEGAATRKQVDDIAYQISVLKKQLEATSEQVDTQNSSIDGQTTSIAAQIDQIDDQMQNAKIVSPIGGVVLAKYAEQGEYAAPGRALFKVADITDMKLRAYITAAQLDEIKLGQAVKVYVDRGDGNGDSREYAGRITWISDKAEFTPKTIQTRDERANLVYAVKISVKNDGHIKRGMYGEVKF